MKEIVVRDIIVVEDCFEEKGNESVVISEEKNLVAIKKIIEVKESIEKDANHIVKETVVKDKIVEELIFEENGNESAVIGEKINIVANEKMIEVKKMLKRMQMIS